MRSRVELFEQIRRDRRLRQLSIRELAERHGVHRRTVRQALESAVPPARKEYARRPRPALDAWVPVIDRWLLADREAPRKQRHTARRVWQRLVAEHGACLAEVTVSRYVARRRRELGLDDVDVAIPQTHLPGAEAEVDFGEFHFDLAGVDNVQRRLPLRWAVILLASTAVGLLVGRHERTGQRRARRLGLRRDAPPDTGPLSRRSPRNPGTTS